MQCNLCNKEAGDKIDRIDIICHECSILIEELNMATEWFCCECKQTNFCSGYVCDYCGKATRKQ